MTNKYTAICSECGEELKGKDLVKNDTFCNKCRKIKSKEKKYANRRR